MAHILTEEQQAEFQAAAEPLIGFLAKMEYPCFLALVTGNGAQVVKCDYAFNTDRFLN